MTQLISRRRGLLAPLIGLSAASLMIAGCSGGTPEPAGSDGSEPQEFTFAYQSANNVTVSPWEVLANRYMEEFPNVTITLNPQPTDTYPQTTLQQLQAGNAADLLQVTVGSGSPSAVVPMAEAGFLEPLEGAPAELPEGAEAQLGFDDEVFGMVLNATVNGVVWSDTVAEEIDLDYPKTMTDLYDACTTASDQGKSLFILAAAASVNAQQLAWAIAMSRVYAENPTWNDDRAAGDTTFADSDGWVEVMQTIVELNEAGCFQAGAEAGGFEAITIGFGQKQSLSAFLPGASTVDLAQGPAEGQTLSLHAFPVDSGQESRVVAGLGYALGVNAEAENKDQALAFLEWASQPENLEFFSETVGAPPIGALSGAAEITLPEYDAVAPLLAEGAYSPSPNLTWPNAEVAIVMASGIQGLLTGQNSPEQVLDEMDAAW